MGLSIMHLLWWSMVCHTATWEGVWGECVVHRNGNTVLFSRAHQFGHVCLEREVSPAVIGHLLAIHPLNREKMGGGGAG